MNRPALFLVSVTVGAYLAVAVGAAEAHAGTPTSTPGSGVHSSSPAMQTSPTGAKPCIILTLSSFCGSSSAPCPSSKSSKPSSTNTPTPSAPTTVSSTSTTSSSTGSFSTSVSTSIVPGLILGTPTSGSADIGTAVSTTAPGELAVTGGDPALLSAVGFFALAVGGFLVVGARRERKH